MEKHNMCAVQVYVYNVVKRWIVIILFIFENVSVGLHFSAYVYFIYGDNNPTR